MANVAIPGLNGNSPSTSNNSSTIQEQISKQAYQLYLERGGHDGFDQDDWHRAEKIVKSRK